MKKSCIILIAGCVCAAAGSSAQSRDADRGRKVLDQAIQALGGPAYLAVRDYHGEGRGFSFSRFEEISSMSPIVNYERYPDKSRQEQGKKHEVLFVLNGDKAWDANFRGVAPVPEAEVARVLLGRKLSVDRILRFRMNEPGLEITYAGADFVDGRPVDKVDVFDRDGDLVTISFDQQTHLPLRREWERKLPNREREQNVETLGKFSPAKNSSVLFPYYVRRERNGIKIFELFLGEIGVNGRTSDALFERPTGKERIDVPSRKR